MESIIGGLVDYGMAGLFIAFMVWQYMQNQKRMDALQDKFLDSIDKVRKENKENEELIRARYDKVVETYQNTKDNLLRELSDTVKDLQSSIIKLESMESSSMIRITELGDTVEDVKSLLDKREQERRAEKEATLIALANQQKNTKE